MFGGSHPFAEDIAMHSTRNVTCARVRHEFFPKYLAPGQNVARLWRGATKIYV